MVTLRGDTGELHRLMCEVETLARTSPVRTRTGQLRRDPSAEWDWYYALGDDTREWIARWLMSDAGERPDALAYQAGFDDVDQWARALVQAIEVARDRDAWLIDPLSDDYQMTDNGNDDLLGPDEVAQLLEVSRATIRKWRQRGLLPVPDLVLSSLPIWYASTIVEWARETGREIV